MIDYLPKNGDKSWIKEVSSKATKQALENANKAFSNFFKKKSQFPRFKKKSKQDVKMYFVKTDAKRKILCERHRIKIPTIGWVKLCEKGYIPTTKSGYVIKSGTVSYKADRYYVSVLVEVPDVAPTKPINEGIGIDLGLKEFVTCSDGRKYKNINKKAKIKKLEKSLKRQQKSLSRKYKKLKKGESTQKNIQKQKLKVQKIHHRIENIRTDYIWLVGNLRLWSVQELVSSVCESIHGEAVSNIREDLQHLDVYI